MRNFFTFNGKSSLDFDVTISGDGTYSSPTRDMTAVSVPGRNGDLLVDNGRYNNVEINYSAFISRDFRKKFDAFRAWMLSNPGYHRLEDTYHPMEYREAAFTSSLNPHAVGSCLIAGKFDITFTCKPQRFLKSGEEQITVYPCKYEGGTIESGGYIVQGIPTKAGEICSAFTQGVEFNDASVIIQFSDQMGTLVSRIKGEGEGSALVSGAAPQTGTAAFIFPVTSVFTTISVGVKTYEYKNGGVVFRNPTPYTARPMIYAVSGSLSGGKSFSFSVNDTTVSVSSFSPGHSGGTTVSVDCENEDVYETYGGKTKSLNGYTSVTVDGETAPEFPRLYAGDNMLYTDLEGTTATIKKYIVVPRWWTI